MLLKFNLSKLYLTVDQVWALYMIIGGGSGGAGGAPAPQPAGWGAPHVLGPPNSEASDRINISLKILKCYFNFLKSFGGWGYAPDPEYCTKYSITQTFL